MSSVPKPTVKVTDPIDMQALQEAIERYAIEKQVVVGVQRGAGPYPDGTSQAMVAAVHEFGAPSRKIPERSFLRRTIRANAKAYARFNRVNLQQVGQGKMSPETALSMLGEKAKGDVQQFIADNDYDIKDATKARKHSSRALIDTGHMRTSIQWLIEDKSDGEK